MKFLDYLLQLPKIFDWYFNLPAIKRIQLNYIALLSFVILLSYYNDQLHRKNYSDLSARIDIINNSRSQEQEKYTAGLQYYTDKLNHLLEILIKQKEEIKQIKKEP
jgi:hypothetical protein